MKRYHLFHKWVALTLVMALTLSFCALSAAGAEKVSHYSKYTDLTYQVPQGTIIDGIDVSSHQGDIDWEKVADDGIEFAIVRVAYRGYETGRLVTDTKAEKNIQGALDAGLKVGLYVFSQAIDEEEVHQEAQALIAMAEKYPVTLPLVFDLEFHSNSSGFLGRQYEAYMELPTGAEKNAWLVQLCRWFCEDVSEAGYEPMIYSFRSLLENLSSSDPVEILGSPCVYWMANYTTNTSYAGECDFWQYSGSGHVDGISTEVDCNFCFNSRWVPDHIDDPEETTPPAIDPPGETEPPTTETPGETEPPTTETPDPDPGNQEESTLTITPTRWPQGNMAAAPYTLSGTVTSNYPITSVTGTIYRADGAVAQTVTASPNAKEFAIKGSVIDNSLAFKKLGSGYYFLCYTAADTSGKEVSWSSQLFAMEPATLFTDITNTSSWYYEPIYALASAGIITGFQADDGTYYFAPEDNVTRAQAVTLLYKLSGSPTVSGTNPFTDTPFRWYQSQIIWAFQNGIITGRTAEIFSPNDPVTREELATMIYRLLKGTPLEENYLSDFVDAGQLHDYAVEPMNWCVANNIVTSDSSVAALLNPRSNASRAQAADMIWRASKVTAEE